MFHKRTSFIIPPDLLRAFKVACAERGDTMTKVIIECIKKYLEQK